MYFALVKAVPGVETDDEKDKEESSTSGDKGEISLDSEEEFTKDEGEFILRVYVDNGQRRVDVPVTPVSTCADILDCLRDPGEDQCFLTELWRGCERTVDESEKPFDILRQWGEHRDEAQFFLRYHPLDPVPAPDTGQADVVDSRRHRHRNGMRDTIPEAEMTLPGGVDLTLSELQDMAARQQQQIESQQQVLVAKEQRLKYLKQQEQKQQHLATENDRLRKLRDKVEAQEMKLKKLRALRGQVEQHRTSNGSLNSELESIKALFNEKEKELTMAVAKVEEMTRQLEDVRNGKVKASTNNHNSASAVELEKLKKELMIRNKLNEQQNAKMSSNRDLLMKRKDDVSKIDNRIHELQMRLKKKRAMQAQNAEKNKNQINQQNNRLNNRHGPPSNVVAVEPYIQQTQPDPARDEVTKPGFGKKDPKYQSLPPSSKLSYADNKDGLKQRETNNNSVDYSRKRLEPDKTEEYSIPLVVTVDSQGGKLPTQNGIPPSIPSPTIRAASQFPAVGHSSAPPKPGQTTKGPPQSVSVQLPPSSSSAGRTAPPVPSRISHWTARPFGSTYSTSMLPNRGVSGVPQQTQPRVDVQEELRLGGSGQSSPASSDSSLRDSAINGGNQRVINLPNNKSGYQGNNNHQNVSPHNLSPNSNSGVQMTGADVPQVPVRSNSEKTANQSSVSQTQAQSGGKKSDSDEENQTISVSKGIAKFSGLIAQKSSETQNFGRGDNSKGSQDSSNGASMSGGFSNLNHASALGAAGHKPLPTYRYAPKSVIATTYFGKMGSEAMEKYQKNVLSLHRNLNASTDKQDNVSVGEEGGKSGNVMDQTGSSVPADDTGSNLSSPLSSVSTPSPKSSSPHVQQPYPFDFPSSPPHADVASDKGSFNPHTPKNIRRRHSDSDNEEIGRAIQKYEISNSNHTSLSPLATQENQLLTLENNETGAIKIQATSFSDTIPETVLLDNRGNVVEVNDNSSSNNSRESLEADDSFRTKAPEVVTNGNVKLKKKTNLKTANSKKKPNRVSFDPLALLLDASLEGELELVKRCAEQVEDVSSPNDEGITALHNAICAGHYGIVSFLIEFGCDVNTPDSDGWTPLHCAASCNNLPMVKFLVEHGACIFATTISDHETAAEKCEEDEDGYDGCSEYLYSTQEKLGIMNNGAVYAVFDYQGQNADELTMKIGEMFHVLRKGDELEKEWWWVRLTDREGYIPRNLLGLTPRVLPRSPHSPEV